MADDKVGKESVFLEASSSRSFVFPPARDLFVAIGSPPLWQIIPVIGVRHRLLWDNPGRSLGVQAEVFFFVNVFLAESQDR